MTETVLADTVLAVVQAYVAEHSYPPSVREIMDVAGLTSTRLVHKALVQLKEEGKVDWEVGRARTLRVIG